MKYIYILLVFLILLVLACNFFYCLAVKAGRKPFLTGNKDLPESFLGGIWAEGQEWLEKAVSYTHL
ncbi:MAG: hypothetical protein N2376_03735, partial [Clostridia bacterium]|nr:hypothetical protein [Clostridia bacterium]